MLNQRDIGSWCGIFATYCYRASGLIIRWDDVKLQSPQYFDTLGANAAVQKGDIGVYDPQINHHFLVIQDAAPGNKVFSIDGNVGNPAEATVSPWNRSSRSGSISGRRSQEKWVRFCGRNSAR